MATKSRAITMEVVVPLLRAKHPDGHVSRPALMAALESAGVPFQPWMTSRVVSRGIYDLSEFFAVSEEGGTSLPPVAVEDHRTDAEVEREISGRFKSLDEMARGVVSGAFRSLIVSGNPGIGKTYGVEQVFRDAKNVEYEKITGYIRATGFYKLLWKHKDANQLLMIDDADAAFGDDVALNLLKTATDSTQQRVVHWRSEKEFEGEDLEEIPDHFEFCGRIVFVTNLDFEKLAKANGRLAPHLLALMSRSFYLDLQMNSTRELLIRLRQVVAHSEILSGHSAREKARIMDYVAAKALGLREISLRSVLKLSNVMRSTSPEDFERVADAVMLRRK